MAFPAMQPSLRRLLLIAAALKLPPSTAHALQKAYSVRRSQMRAITQQLREKSKHYFSRIRESALPLYRHFAAATPDSDLWIASAVMCAIVFLMFVTLGPSKRSHGHAPSTKAEPSIPPLTIHGVVHTNASPSTAGISPVSDVCQTLLQLPYDPHLSAPGKNSMLRCVVRCILFHRAFNQQKQPPSCLLMRA